jgi:hypothetical protein
VIQWLMVALGILVSIGLVRLNKVIRNDDRNHLKMVETIKNWSKIDLLNLLRKFNSYLCLQSFGKM